MGGPSNRKERVITRSFSRIKRLKTGVSLPRPIAEMEEQCKQPESPVERVLKLPELLAVIFGHLAADSDLKSLKNVRLVCSLWKSCAFSAFKDNLSLIPLILDGEFYEKDEPAWKILPNCAHKDIMDTFSTLKPSCGFPLKLAVNRWSGFLADWIQDFSKEIVSFWICGMDFEGFGAYGNPSFELPSLEHAVFSGLHISRSMLEREEFVAALNAWKIISDVPQQLKTCCLDFKISKRNPLKTNDSALDMFQWSQVRSLTCAYAFFEEISSSNELSALRKLEFNSLNDPEQKEIKNQFLLEKGGNLQELMVGWGGDFKLNEMKNLTVLHLKGGTASGPESLSKLLPILRRVEISEDYVRSVALPCLTRDGDVFESVVELKVWEGWGTQDNIDNSAAQLFDSFPNLTNLEWISKEKGLDENFTRTFSSFRDPNKNALRAAPVIFSKLEFLTTLSLTVDKATASDIVLLVTGNYPEEIPQDEETWDNALVGRQEAICNLRRLTVFELNSSDYNKIWIAPRETRFLFAAAFRTMDSLQELHFRKIDFEDRECVNAWEESGRKFTVCDSRYLTVDYESDIFDLNSSASGSSCCDTQDLWHSWGSDNDSGSNSEMEEEETDEDSEDVNSSCNMQ